MTEPSSSDRDMRARISALIEGANSIAVLTGAGMSAESGIPTFRGDRNGLWSRFDPETLATPDPWHADKELVWGWYLWRMAMVRRAQPNPGHLALARLAQRKPGLSIVTQNVDDLHERAGSENVVHLHGSLFASRCFVCASPADAIDIPFDAFDAPILRITPPRCIHCGAYIRPGVVWFHETLPQEAWRKAVLRVEACELLLVIGTSGLVYPAARLPTIARESGAFVVEINSIENTLSADSDLSWRITAARGLAAL